MWRFDIKSLLKEVHWLMHGARMIIAFGILAPRHDIQRLSGHILGSFNEKSHRFRKETFQHIETQQVTPGPTGMFTVRSKVAFAVDRTATWSGHIYPSVTTSSSQKDFLGPLHLCSKFWTVVSSTSTFVNA